MGDSFGARLGARPWAMTCNLEPSRSRESSPEDSRSEASIARITAGVGENADTLAPSLRSAAPVVRRPRTRDSRRRSPGVPLGMGENADTLACDVVGPL